MHTVSPLRSGFVFSAFVLITGIGSLSAAPLAILDRTNLRSDFAIAFTQVGPATGTAVPNNFSFNPSDGGAGVGVTTQGGNMSVITGGGSYFTSGTLLYHSGPGALLLYPGRNVQGFGVTIESNFGERASYKLEAFTASSVPLQTATAVSSGTGGEPAFLGVMDPDARIGILRLTSGPSGPNSFVLSAPVFQITTAPGDHPSTLPVMAGFNFKVDGSATYLHEGLNSGTPGTIEATVDNPNTIDLQKATRFPSLRGGDVLRFQAGFSTGNALLAVLSRTQEIKAGTQFARVPGSVNAGADYPTPMISGGSFPTPTDIGSDFIIGSKSFVEVPTGARYLMFSLAQPISGFSGGVQVDWIPRTLFENWLLTQGLVGSLAGITADPDGDGLNNIEEFAYGKDPTSGQLDELVEFAFSPNGQLFGSGADERMVLAFGGLAAGPVQYRPAFSTDLINWQIGSPLAISAILYNGDATRAVFQTVDPVAGSRRRFGRIFVDYIPRP